MAHPDGISTKAGAKKTINKVKAALLARQGPAEKDQSRSPIADAIARYWEDDVLSFSIPAHGGGRGPAPEFTKWAGLESARADLPTHVLIETAPIGLTGYRALDWLRLERHLDVELADHRRIMPLITFAHGDVEIDRLVRGLRDLVDAHPDEDGSDILSLPSRPEIRSEAPMLPRDAFFASTETVKFDQAAGRISAELITPYPPGIPAVAPGELYTDENLSYLQAFVEAGGFVEGAADPTLQNVRVISR